MQHVFLWGSNDTLQGPQVCNFFLSLSAVENCHPTIAEQRGQQVGVRRVGWLQGCLHRGGCAQCL